jgi:hypothetical protein
MILSMFRPEQLPHPVRYDLLFEHLPLLPEKNYRIGRPPFPVNAILKALLYKALSQLPSLSELAFGLRNNPSLYQTLGFNTCRSAPSIERFSRFLRDTNNQILQTIRRQLIITLIAEGVVQGKRVAFDSCPIPVQVKQNNLKTSVKDRFDKTVRLPLDPEARLGIMVHFPKPFQKNIVYFWGYRNHVLSDTATELPLGEITRPANISETKVAIDLLKMVKEELKLSPEAVIGDANYDAEKVIGAIVDDVKAIPIIPRNPRGLKSGNHTIKQGKVYCAAYLPMYRKGKMRPKETGILYCQYSCPLHYGKEQSQYLVCPVFHESFFKGKGCNVLIRMEPSVREQIPYDTEYFKEAYHERTSVERTFARLLAIAMQKPSVYGLQALSNHVTIAHIAVLLVALAAHQSGHTNKIRFVKSFVPKFL